MTGAEIPATSGESERRARVVLSLLTEPGDTRVAALIAELGAPGLVASLRAERDLHGVRTDVAQRLAELDPDRELAQAAAQGIRFVIPGDAEWPRQLTDLERCGTAHHRGGPPLGLWVRGAVRLDHLAPMVAIVGSRSSTTYGSALAHDLAYGLSEAGLLVVSGAAYGIDYAAHRGALASHHGTVAVLASGVDRAYPAGHRSLLDFIADHGAVISEAPPGRAPTRVRFLARNRLIAGLSRGCVVVEAALRSGALSTANWSASLGRHVMGVPGPVTSATSQGVHELVRSGSATLVTNVADVLEILSVSGDHLIERRRGPATARDRLNPRQQQVLDAVPRANAAEADSIARVAGVGLVEVRGTLQQLHRKGLVEQLPRGWVISDLALERPEQRAPVA